MSNHIEMPVVELTEMELQEAARGQRSLIRQAKEDAERQGGSSTRQIFEDSIRWHQALEAKFEAARKSGQTQQKPSTTRK